MRLGWTLLDQTCQVCFTPLVRSPAPQRQLLCVKCGRDTTNAPSAPNGPGVLSNASVVNGLPSSYHPLVDGDDMTNDEEEQDPGVMEVDGSLRPNQTECIQLNVCNVTDNSGSTGSI